MTEPAIIQADTIAIPHECRVAECQVTIETRQDGRIYASHNGADVGVYAAGEDLNVLDVAILVQHVREELAGQDADHRDGG